VGLLSKRCLSLALINLRDENQEAGKCDETSSYDDALYKSITAKDNNNW